MFSADSILSVPLDSPEHLFKKKEDIDSVYKQLLKEWHPDISHDPKASEVTAHLNLLKSRAHAKVDTGAWNDGRLIVALNNGKTKAFSYRKRCKIEYGEILYNGASAVFVFTPENKKLFESCVSSISTLHYANPRMQGEVGIYMPTLNAAFTGSNGHSYLSIPKKDKTYLLSDLVAAMGGTVPPEHVAWMISRTLNICCYLEWSKMSHGDVSPSSLFVEPSTHSLYLLGGWGYATPYGQDMSFLPERSVQVMPPGLKQADGRLDLILVRKMARDLLGIKGRVVPKGVPRALADFSLSPVSGSAMEDYKTWNDVVLPASFDVSRFVKLEVHDEAVFKESP